ncbi:hypothetical protein L3i20_v210380 [Paenibacillus sp. L3-i20]|nr:hypothetical protein L3i20_v210380 [Paenibacillus sp. L3-i20]
MSNNSPTLEAAIHPFITQALALFESRITSILAFLLECYVLSYSFSPLDATSLDKWLKFDLCDNYFVRFPHKSTKYVRNNAKKAIQNDSTLYSHFIS